MVWGELLADPVYYLAGCPVVASVFFVIDRLLQAVRVKPMVVEQGRDRRLAASVPVHPRTRAVVGVQVVDTAPRLRFDGSPRVVALRDSSDHCTETSWLGD